MFNIRSPVDTYIPDGEPHVIGDRIYLFGSHDTEGYHNDLYAPDVVQGGDGRYYLYHNIDGRLETNGHNLIQVAVCDTPVGQYEYYGYVRNPDGTPYREYLDGDPAVLNDDGVIRIYHGWSLSMTAAAHDQGRAQRGGDDRQQGAAAQDKPESAVAMASRAMSMKPSVLS